MAYEQKDNSGSLFKNDKREKDTHAHARGNAMIDGVQYWIDAWTNTDKNGNKYQSLKFKRKEDRAQEIRDAYEEASSGPEDADDLPF